ncbi:transcription termination factor 1 [Sphaerodactylus townsendi]|uniref:transcription termination factor 1 n=1 Tax=Sphaerodactylus townsendi TaxID=933632 RepID=UPI002026673E|nr:transcription termination factor 1 [Sphaerodactylus townsendi]XP_048368047.1 transcription termination factor 1 [Sphaerodactylus townsendi]
MTNATEESCIDGFHISDSLKKKERKRKKLPRETHLQLVGAGFCSPFASDPSILPWRFDDQPSEGIEAPQKKSKKKSGQDRSDAQSDYSCTTTESELTSEAGTGVFKPKKKKKKKKRKHEPENGEQLCVPLSQEKASSQHKANCLGNEHWSDRGVKKKKAKQDEAIEVSTGSLKNTIGSASSADKHEEASHNSVQDTELELFPSLLYQTQYSSFSQKERATKLDILPGLDSPVAPKKPRKHKNSSAMEDPDSIDVAPRKPRKHKQSSDVEVSDSTNVVPRRPHKHKNSPTVEDPDSADIDPRRPHEHKKSSDMEIPDSTDVVPRMPRKHKKSSATEDPDSSEVDPTKPHKHKNSSAVEDLNRLDVVPRKPRKHKHSSDVEVSNSTNVVPRKPRKHKNSSAVEDSDSTDVDPRKPHKHKKPSATEDPDSNDVDPTKPRKHKKSSATEDPDSTNVPPTKPHKHKNYLAVEDPDSIDVDSRKPLKHKKSSGMVVPDSTDVGTIDPDKHKNYPASKDPDSIGVVPRKPRKHKKSSAVVVPDSTDVGTIDPDKHKNSPASKDPDSLGVVPRKPRKHKHSSAVGDPNSINVVLIKPHRHTNYSAVDDPDSFNVDPGNPHKHKQSSTLEHPDTTNVDPRMPRKHKNSSVEYSGSTDFIPRKPQKHKNSSDMEDPDSTDVAPTKPRKHKKSSGMEDPDSTDVAPTEPRKHKKSSGMVDPDSTDVAPTKPRKHKKSSGVKDPESTDVAPTKPCKHKKPCDVEDPANVDIAPRKPRKHKKSSDVEDPANVDVAPTKPRKHKKPCDVEDPANVDIAPRKPRKHKKSSDVEDPANVDVAPTKPRKHKKPCDVEDPANVNVAPRKPRKHTKSSDVVDSDTTDIGSEMEETVKSATVHDSIGNKSRVTRVPLEDSNKLPDPTKDGRELPPTKGPTQPVSQSFFIEHNEYLDCDKLAVPDLDKATQELEEFIPHVRNLSASAVKQMARRDLIRFKNFKQKGVSVKFGKFTQKENDQLKKNVEDFLQESGIESAEKLLFTQRFPEDRAAINKLKARLLFGIRIAEGIPRPWRLVYYRARKIFDPRNSRERYSDQEKRKLMEYQAMYGNNWKRISELMSRTSHSVALKYSQMKSEPKSGRWSKEETKKLIQAVEGTLRANCREFCSALEEENEGKALSVVRENLYKGISWVKVEAMVGTRHWRQCKKKWMSIVTKRMSRGRVMASGRENLQFKINLIERLHDLNIEDANEVDWEVLSSIIGDVPPDYIQGRFYKLKATHVPFWNQKTLPEIIDHLYNKTLPALRAVLEKRLSKSLARAQAAQVKCQRQVFQFSDIFQESSDELPEDSTEESEEEEAVEGPPAKRGPRSGRAPDPRKKEGAG